MSAIYVSDWRRHAVLRLTQLGDAQPTLLGGFGGGPGQFDTPCGLAVDSLGRLYVADRGNHRVIRVDAIDGIGWVTLGTLGAGAGQFRAPTDVFLDGDDRLYIADTGNHRVVRVDGMDGAGWQTFGLPGRPTAADPVGVDKLAEPSAVCVDDQGRVVIADRGNGRIVRVNDLSGAGWSAFGPAPAGDDRHLIGPTCVRPASGGAVLVADFGGRRLIRLADLGVAALEVIHPDSGGEAGLLGPASVTALVAAGDGLPGENLLVVDAPGRRLLRLERGNGGGWVLAQQQPEVGGDASRLFGLCVEAD